MHCTPLGRKALIVALAVGLAIGNESGGMMASINNCTIVVPATFYMVLGVTGVESQDTFPLYYAPTPNPVTVTADMGPHVMLYCQDESKSMSIMNASGWTAAYSNTVGGTGFPAVKINSGCEVDTLFNVVLDQATFRYTLSDSDGQCVARVLDTPDKLVQMVSCTNDNITFASAVMTWSDSAITTPDGSFPFSASWRADLLPAAAGSPPADLLTLYIITMMAIKRNNGMECTPTPPTSPPSPTAEGLSSAAIIVIAVLVSAFVAVGVYVGLRQFYKRIDYAQLRQAMNENHES